MSIDIHFSYTLPIVTIDFPTWDAQKSQKPWPGRSGDTANRVACNVYIYIYILCYYYYYYFLLLLLKLLSLLLL